MSFARIRRNERYRALLGHRLILSLFTVYLLLSFLCCSKLTSRKQHDDEIDKYAANPSEDASISDTADASTVARTDPADAATDSTIETEDAGDIIANPNIEIWIGALYGQNANVAFVENPEEQEGFFLHYHDREWTVVDAPPGTRGINHLSFAGPDKGVASDGYVLLRYDGESWTVDSAFASLISGPITDVMMLSDEIWVATFVSLFRYSDGTWIQIDTSQLSDDTIYDSLFERVGKPGVIYHTTENHAPASYAAMVEPIYMYEVGWYDSGDKLWQKDWESLTELVDVDSTESGWTIAVGSRITNPPHLTGRGVLRDVEAYLFDGDRWETLLILPDNQPEESIGPYAISVSAPSDGVAYIICRKQFKFNSLYSVFKYQEGEFQLLEDPRTPEGGDNMKQLVASSDTSFLAIGNKLETTDLETRELRAYGVLIQYDSGQWVEQRFPMLGTRTFMFRSIATVQIRE